MATKKSVKTVKKSTVKKPTKTSTVKSVTARKPLALFSSPLKGKPFVVALIAEFIGTFLFASSIIAGQGQPIIILFALAGIVLVVGALSGAYLNPALAIGGWVTRKLSGLRALGYIVAEFLGALAALGLLNAFVGGAAASTAGYAPAALYQAAILPIGKEWYVFFAELVGTAILGFVIATAVSAGTKRITSALTAGLGIFVALLFAASAAAYVSGTAILNPAVALSLQALKWEVWPLAVYVLAPVVGAVIGFVLHDLLKVDSNK